MFGKISIMMFVNPKSEIGLGIRKNNDVSKASITKLGWRILIDKNSIWARIMWDKNVTDNNFSGFPRRMCGKK